MKKASCFLIAFIFIFGIFAGCDSTKMQDSTSTDIFSKIKNPYDEETLSSLEMVSEIQEEWEKVSIVEDESEVIFADINREQAQEVSDRVFTALNNHKANYFIQLYPLGIENVTGNSQLRKFIVSNKDYYYQAFNYNNNKMIVLYNDYYQAIGLFYYSDYLNSVELKKCKTLVDVINLGSFAEDDIENIMTNAASVMNAEFEIESSGHEKIWCVTNEGFYVLAFENYIGNTEASTNKVLSVIKVENEVLDAVYDMINNL